MAPDKVDTELLTEQLLRLASKSENPDEGADDHEGELYRCFSIHTERGRILYESLPDKFLTGLLIERADQLGHSPAQKEMFWVWREYIKARFKRWPYALKAAGLSKAAGREGKSREQFEREKNEHRRLVERLREIAAAECRIPHPGDVPEIDAAVKKSGKSWADLVKEAGLNDRFFTARGTRHIEDLSDGEKELLNKILETAWRLGRPPLKREIPGEVLEPLTERCGSYRNVLYQIGLAPVEKKRPFISSDSKTRDGERRRHRERLDLKDCYYQVLSKDAQYEADLKALKEWTDREGRQPDRNEIAPELRKRLQTACGSWSNALKQLEYTNNGSNIPLELESISIQEESDEETNFNHIDDNSDGHGDA